jgi:glycerophosphoryl diester phosphodiesterase
VRLIQKYNRQSTTIIGAENEEQTLEMHALDPSIPKFMSSDAAIKYMILYLSGLLPFVKIDHHEVAALPYMTRDYLRMKLIEAREKTAFYYAFIVVVTFANRCLKGMIEHFNRRGIHTNYWVINDDDEVRNILKSGPVRGIMTDRPSAVMQIVREETARQKYEDQAELIRRIEKVIV